MATNTKKVVTVLLTVIVGALLFPYACVGAQTQTATTFTPQDKFSLPTLNSTISFALNGSCTSANLVNDKWVFTNLRLNNSQPLGNLTITTSNSNITIFSFRSNNFIRSSTLRYNAQGAGTQTVDLGLGSAQTQIIEWSVSIPSIPGIRSGFLAEGHSWNLLHNNTVFVYGLTGNVSVSHFSFPVQTDSNLPFYQQHSIIIVTVIVVLVLAAVAMVVRVKVRR
jgi:hypothetical protein